MMSPEDIENFRVGVEVMNELDLSTGKMREDFKKKLINQKGIVIHLLKDKIKKRNAWIEKQINGISKKTVYGTSEIMEILYSRDIDMLDLLGIDIELEALPYQEGEKFLQNQITLSVKQDEVVLLYSSWAYEY